MRRQWIIVLLLVSLIAVAFFTLRHGGEPVIRGKPLTYWLEPGRQHPKEPPEAIAAIVAEMDERCVKFLIRELDWVPSRLVSMANAPLRRLSIVLFQDRPDHRALAAATLAKLGPRAAPGIPALARLARTGIEPRAADARGAAIAALVLLRHDPLGPLLGKLSDPSDPDWSACATAMCYLGTNAAVAVPLLVTLMETSTNDWVKLRATGVLSAICSHSELSVPALTRALQQTNSSARYSAINGLWRFGQAARSAWDALLPCLNDRDVLVRVMTTNALRQIDPEAARQLGIN